MKSKKTKLVYDNITVQLSKKNTRFQYKLIKKGGRASEFETAIEWLGLSGIVYVNVQLSINGYKAYYWESGRGAEVDFIIQRDGNLIPIEVKSADNTKVKSLKVYMDTYKPAYAIKLSAKNFGFEDKKKTFPLYAAFCI